ncbi:MAG: leucine-rich repeat protein, partial [Prevotella sp.]|nr:leucine-rich repeat protein [Prevotella sp.]
MYDSRNNCNAIIETSTNTLISGCKNTSIPNSVTTIGDGAFHGCSGLTSITIPNSVTTIGDGAFHGCSGLTSIT